MKTLIKLLALLALAMTTVRSEIVEIVVPEEANPEVIRDAGKEALDKALDELFAIENLPKQFAILPLQGDLDGGYFTTQLRNKFAVKGSPMGISLYTRYDSGIEKIIQDEIQRGQEVGDIMDPDTIQEFGRQSGVAAMVVGKLESITLKEEDAELRLRITFQAYEMETGRLIWGTEAVGTAIDENYKKQWHAYVDEAGSKVRSLDVRTWYWIGAGAIALIVLFVIVGRIKAAARPR